MLWLFKRLLKLDSPITVGDWIYTRIVNNWVTIASVLGGLLMAYLAKITDWIRPWGAVGWGFVGLGSALVAAPVLSVVTYAIGAAAKRRAEAKAIRKWSDQVDGINPMEREFRHERIRLSDLANPITLQVIGKRFIGCELIGPVTILLGRGCSFRMVGLEKPI